MFIRLSGGHYHIHQGGVLHGNGSNLGGLEGGSSLFTPERIPTSKFVKFLDNNGGRARSRKSVVLSLNFQYQLVGEQALGIGQGDRGFIH
jgi:hypothetical protein